MIMSSQEVYDRLLLPTPDHATLNFDTLALAAVDHDGMLNQEKLRELIRLLRPDRDGNLTLLDFVKVCEVSLLFMEGTRPTDQVLISALCLPFEEC